MLSRGETTGHAQAPARNEPGAIKRWVELRVTFGQPEFCRVDQDIAVRMALSEKAEPFEHRAVTELVGIVDQQAWLAVFTLHVLCETIGNMLDAAAGRRIIEHVDDRPVDIRDENPALAALGYMREGDVLVVWKLDRLARSLKQLIETVEAMN